MESKVSTARDAAIAFAQPQRNEILNGQLIPRGVGQATMYSPDYPAMLPSMMENGEGGEEVAAQFGIARSTFYGWLNKHQELRDAYEIAQTKSVAWWTRLAREGAQGLVRVIPAVLIFNLKNRAGWKDKVEIDINAIPGGQNNDDIDGLSLDDAAEVYKREILGITKQ